MFRAIHKKQLSQLYIIGDHASEIKDLAEMAAKGLLVCESCKKPLNIIRGHMGIWSFCHSPPTVKTPRCYLRYKNFLSLFNLQIGKGPHSKNQREINLIKSEDHFRISDETRRHFAALERNESIRKRVIKPIPAYMPCFCQYCGETTTEWNQIDFTTRVGSCRDCSKIVHDDEIWILLLLTKNPHWE